MPIPATNNESLVESRRSGAKADDIENPNPCLKSLTQSLTVKADDPSP